MRTGILCFNNDPMTDLQGKVTHVAAYYQKKFGCCPNLCFVHPSMLQTGVKKTGEIELRSSRQVLPDYFWLGISESTAVRAKKAG